MKVIPHLILCHHDKILLSRRTPTQTFYPTLWHCVSGSVEEGESPQHAIVRETEEEIGILLKELPKLVTTLWLAEPSALSSERIFYALELFFLATLPEGQVPQNMEPTKQDALEWFLPNKLPHPMVPVVALGIE